MKFRFWVFTVFLLSFLLFSCSENEITKIDLSSGWQYSTVNPDRDDCSFKLLPDAALNNLKTLIPEKSGTIYLKKDFIIPLELQKEDISIYLGHIASSDKTYINHYLIGNTTSGESHFFSFFNVPRYYEIPEELLVPGVNTIIIEIQVNRYGYLRGNCFISYFSEAKRAYTSDRFFSELLYFALSVILFFISLFLIIKISRFYNKSEVAVFCIILILTAVNLSYFFINDIPYISLEKINYEIYSLIFHYCLPAAIFIIFSFYIYSFIKKNHDYKLQILFSVCVIPFFIILDLFFHYGLKYNFVPVLSYYSFPVCLICIFFVLISKKIRELKPLKTAEDLKFSRIIPKIIDTENFQAAYFFKSARGVKELMYDIFLEENKLKGIAVFETLKNSSDSTNLIMLAKQIAGKTFNDCKKLSLPKVMEKILRKIAEENISDNQISGSLLRFSDSKVEYVNSFHTTAYYRVSKTGIAVPVRLPEDKNKGSGIGFTMLPGDAVILYSRTFENSQNPENEPFSAQRIQQAFKQSGSGTSLSRLEYILNMFQNYTNNVPNNHDLVLLIVQKK